MGEGAATGDQITAITLPMVALVHTLLAISSDAIPGIVLLLVLTGLLIFQGMHMRKFRGRTIREFTSTRDVSDIMQVWAEGRKCMMVQQTEPPDLQETGSSSCMACTHCAGPQDRRWI